MAIADVPCDLIQIGERHRKDLGDLEVLAASIATDGQLQPIGITEDYRLVFGERRFKACRDVLKRNTIQARVVRVRSITAGEYAENEIRKDFTSSERVAIGKTLEAEIGDRQGCRTDIELRKNVAKVEPGVRTEEIAAKKAGFGNRTTYEQAKKVVDQGVPELVDAMDSGAISISAAALIAGEPGDRQSQIVQMPGEVRRQVVRDLREAAKLPTPGEARRLARETGMAVADNTGVYRSGAPPEQVREAKADAVAIYTVTRGIAAIAETSFDPGELAARLEYWHCPGIREKAAKALAWLDHFQKGLQSNEQIH
ncbi:MAG: ParB/RepB/Spo0J family partition protein [Bryobacteraceae bacterium]